MPNLQCLICNTRDDEIDEILFRDSNDSQFQNQATQTQKFDL